jgi:hypothetical protein
MSKFQSTVSVVAALASIFGAGAAGWKLAQESGVKPTEEQSNPYEQHITELQKQISNLEQQTKIADSPAPAPAQLPAPAVPKQPIVQPPVLPPPPVPPTPPQTVATEQ